MSYTRDSIKKFVQDNINSLIDDGVIAGRVIEQMVAKKNNWKNVGGNNFSYDHVDEDDRCPGEGDDLPGTHEQAGPDGTAHGH